MPAFRPSHGRVYLSIPFSTSFDFTSKLLALVQRGPMRREMMFQHLLIREFQIAGKTSWRMCVPFMSLHIQQLNKSLVAFIAEVSRGVSLLDMLSYLRLHIRCKGTPLVGVGTSKCRCMRMFSRNMLPQKMFLPERCIAGWIVGTLQSIWNSRDNTL